MSDATTLRLQAELRRYDRTYSLEELAEVVAAMEGATDPETLVYPWPDLEARLGGGRLPLLAYGSLMNEQSARRTLANYADLRPTPVVAFGGKRFYHYRMPREVVDRYPPTVSPLERAALNVVGTRNPEDYFNAVLLGIPLTDLPGLREREKQYDLIPLPFLLWDGRTGAVRTAYALSSPPGPNGKVEEGLLPHPAYHQVCLTGACGFGTEFGDCFSRTSFLTDGRAAAELA
jgi:hypothetical protein